MTSDGYRIALESAVRDAQEDIKKMYEARLFAKDQEIKKLQARVIALEEQLNKYTMVAAAVAMSGGKLLK